MKRDIKSCESVLAVLHLAASTASLGGRGKTSTIMFKRNRIVNAVIPAFLLALSVGQIYAFTNFSTAIAEAIGETKSAVQFAFSLGIFFLGMGAAFFGRIVERNITLATCIGTALFLGGLGVTSVGVSVGSLALVYVGYGLMLGLGTGIIYISPVKTMMLWFPKHKAIAAALPIISFGLGSTFSTIAYRWIEPFGIVNTFSIYALVYLPLMVLSACLLRKPYPVAVYGGWHLEDGRIVDNFPKPKFSYRELLHDEFFIRSWVFMFLNISCGLMLIPLARQMMNTATVGYGAGTIAAIVALSGVMNGGGRFAFAWWSDALKHRRNILLCILGISVLTMCGALSPLMIGVALLVINACYGAGFSVIPGILADNFGMDNLSKIHGAVLSAWGFAGLVGNQAAIVVSDTFGFGYYGVVVMLILLYVANFINARRLAQI